MAKTIISWNNPRTKAPRDGERVLIVNPYETLDIAVYNDKQDSYDVLDDEGFGDSFDPENYPKWWTPIEGMEVLLEKDDA